jgi:hypothetical protein
MARDGSPNPNGDRYFKKSDVAQDLGRVLGLDLTNASTQFLQEATEALSEEEEENTLPMAVEKRYSQVRYHSLSSMVCLTIL